MAKPPRLDGRTADQVLSVLLARAPGYTPGWQPASGTAGNAILSVFSRTIAIEGTALDAMPERSRTSFLDTLGNSLLPAQPARAPLVFTLMDSAPLDVSLPAGTQVAASLPPATPATPGAANPPADAPLYFVEQSVDLTRGKLAASHSIDPAADTYHDHSADLTSGPVLFGSLVPVPHVLYLGHDELFTIAATGTSSRIEIILSFDVAPAREDAAPSPLLLDWEYYADDEWIALDIVEDDTARFTRDGRITLSLTCGPDAKQATFGGYSSYWIRGSVRAQGPTARVAPLPAGWHILVDPPSALVAGLSVTVDGTHVATILRVDGREVTLDRAVNGQRAGAILLNAFTSAFVAEVASVTDATHLTVVGVDSGRTLTINGRSRACVIGADNTTSVLAVPLTGPVGAQLVDVETGHSLGTLKQVLPQFRVPVLDGSEFLAGDIVTADGNSSAAISSAGPTFLLLEAAIGGATVGSDVVLANARAPLAYDDTNPPDGLPLVDVIRVQVGISTTGIVPDSACNDSVPIDVRTVFRPFGVQPEKFTSFYVASSDVFKRAGATIWLAFTLASPGVGYSDAGVPGVGGGSLEWAIEYFDGDAWTALGDADALKDDTVALTSGSPGDVTRLSFTCPADWSELEVNGSSNLWLRIRIVSGNYGHPLRLSVVTSGSTSTMQVDPDTLAAPVLIRLALEYSYLSRTEAIDYCLTFNDFAFSDRTVDAQWPNRPFAPFTRATDQSPAVHFGFSEKPPAGIVSLFAASKPDSLDRDLSPSPFVWEYLGARGWTELSVADETSGFAKAGVIQFVGPPDAVSADGLGGVLYRIRARLKTGFDPDPRPLVGVWLNGVWARQGESVSNETLGISNGNSWQTLVFQSRRIPVAPGEVIEVREWTGRGDDWETAVAGVPLEDLRFEVDPRDGRTKTAVWVHWHERPHLFDSGPADRHYALERSTGVLRFGGPVFGMIPPAGARIVATYTAGGDVSGNVSARTITDLHSGIGYIQSVTNPIAASGGTAVEDGWTAESRSTQRLANRYRSVSATDYEWMAHEASPEVARARCLPLEGPPGAPLRGWVTLVLVPHTTDPEPEPSLELVQRVLAFVRARVPAGVGPRVRVATPHYVTVSVQAEIVLLTGAAVATVDSTVRQSLARFLHPLTGGSRSRGFQFGETLYLSDVASLLEGIEGVDFVRRLQLEADGGLQGDVIVLPAHALPTAGDHLITLSLGVS